MISIQKILEKTTDTKAIEISQGAYNRVSEMFNQLFPNKTAAIIADINTFDVAGKTVQHSLELADIRQVKPLILTDPDLYAEWSYLEQVEEYLKDQEAIGIAVGSGVINDLTKLASEHLGQRYMVCGTAASMDGYTAYGASITYQGNKQTFSCKAPYGIILDPVTAAKAPKELTASGYADLIAKVPAGADWMIADAIGKEEIDPFAWDILNQELKQSLSHPRALYNGDTEEIKGLANLLILSGFAMQAMHSSRPASGTEHQYSHCWDIENLCINGKHVSHGFKVGIGTLISTASLEFLLNYDMSKIDIQACVEAWPTWEDTKKHIEELTSYNPGLLSRCLTESQDKYASKAELKSQLETFLAKWPDLKTKIRKHIYSYSYVKECLRQVGAPYEPEMIQVSRAHLEHTFNIIPYMRSRFTNIDIIQRLGLLNQLHEYLFGKGGYYEF